MTQHLMLTSDDMRRLIGMRFRALRLDKRRNQREGAKDLGIPRSTLSSIETGAMFPNLVLAHHMCQHYNAPMDFLFTGKGLDRVLTTKLGTLAQRAGLTF